MPGFSFFMTLLLGVGAWSVRSLSNLVIAGGVLVGLALAGTGLVGDVEWPLTVGVFASSLFLGVGVGRAISPRSAPMALLLGVLSVADIIWIGSGGGSTTGRADAVVNFSVQIGASSSSIGTLDLLIASAIAAHWLKRNAHIWIAIAAAPIGMAISNIYVAFTGADNLPLVPFIAIGWLITEAWHRRLAPTRTQNQT